MLEGEEAVKPETPRLPVTKASGMSQFFVVCVHDNITYNYTKLKSKSREI
jgi:hypothetical protein